MIPYWDKKNEIIKRCWAVNNATEMVSNNLSEIKGIHAETLIKDWYQFFYDWHTEWDIEMADPEQPKDTEYKGKPLKPWESSSLGDDKATQDGQDEIDKENL